MKKVIEFKNVSKSYRLGLTRTSLPSLISGWAKQLISSSPSSIPRNRDIWALKDVSFVLESGQSLALIGPNGAGKTTVLKLLANITQQTSGQIETHGRLSALIELGAGFHPELTGRENIYLNGTILGIKKKELDQKFDEIVDFSGLEKFIDTPIKRYSSGMNVRLGFSVAACIEPEILLVDEVLAVGDSIFRQKCIDRIHELIKGGTSIIFVSHNLWLVQSVCSQAIYLNKGLIEAYGDTAEVIDLYDQAINEERAQKYLMVSEDKIHPATNIEITGVEVIPLDGQSQDLKNDQAAEIRVEYSAYRDIGDVNVVIRIIRSDGLTCCMMRTKVDQFPLKINRGNGLISLVLDPLQLYGGSYHVHAMMRDANDAIEFTSASSKWFSVSGSVLSHQTMNGVYEPNRKWHFDPHIDRNEIRDYEQETIE